MFFSVINYLYYQPFLLIHNNCRSPVFFLLHEFRSNKVFPVSVLCPAKSRLLQELLDAWMH